MTNPITHAPSVAILFADGGEPSVGHTTWNQITKAGTYEGHRQGAFAFNAETTAQILANFAANGNKRVVCDFEHLSEIVPDGAAVTGVPAVAWITALEDRDGDVWAAFEWVDARAVEMVRARRYLYVSPAVDFAARDKVTNKPIGARLTSVALTNHPFLDGMESLAASDRPTVTASLTPDAVHVPAAIAVVPTPKPKRPPMDESEMKAMADAAAKYKALAARVCKMADLDPEAGEDAALAAIEAKIAEMKKAQAAEAASMSDRVIASGRAPESARAKLAALCLSDRETFVALYPAQVATDDAKLMSGRVSPQGGAAPAKADAEAVKSHSDDAHDRAAKLMSADTSLSYSKALAEASRTLRDEALAPYLHGAR